MTYYEDVFKKRVLFRGNTKKEVIVSEAEVQFLENLATSANMEEVTIDGAQTQTIILTNKSDQAKLSMELHSQNSVSVGPGSIVVWDAEDWLVMSTDKLSAPSHVKSIMFKSNLRVKFYDDDGNLHDLPGVFLGSLDSVLREAVYRQMGMTIQLDDRRAMLIISGHILRNNKRLMLDGRVWRIVDYDSTSNKSLVYLSLQEEHIDPSIDDVENGIADGLTATKWTLNLPITTLQLKINDTYMVHPTITKNGVVDETAEWLLASSSDEVLVTGATSATALEEGEAVLTVSLKNNPSIFATITVSVVAEPVPTIFYELVGDSTIRQGDYRDYRFVRTNADGTKEPIATTFVLSDEDGAPTTLATIKRKNTMDWTVTANEKSQVGNVLLKVTYEAAVYEKTIAIRSLW